MLRSAQPPSPSSSPFRGAPRRPRAWEGLFAGLWVAFALGLGWAWPVTLAAQTSDARVQAVQRDMRSIHAGLMGHAARGADESSGETESTPDSATSADDSAAADQTGRAAFSRTWTPDLPAPPAATAPDMPVDLPEPPADVPLRQHWAELDERFEDDHRMTFAELTNEGRLVATARSDRARAYYESRVAMYDAMLRDVLALRHAVASLDDIPWSPANREVRRRALLVADWCHALSQQLREHRRAQATQQNVLTATAELAAGDQAAEERATRLHREAGEGVDRLKPRRDAAFETLEALLATLRRDGVLDPRLAGRVALAWREAGLDALGQAHDEAVAQERGIARAMDRRPDGSPDAWGPEDKLIGAGGLSERQAAWRLHRGRLELARKAVDALTARAGAPSLELAGELAQALVAASRNAAQIVDRLERARVSAERWRYRVDQYGAATLAVKAAASQASPTPAERRRAMDSFQNAWQIEQEILTPRDLADLSREALLRRAVAFAWLEGHVDEQVGTHERIRAWAPDHLEQATRDADLGLSLLTRLADEEGGASPAEMEASLRRIQAGQLRRDIHVELEWPRRRLARMGQLEADLQRTVADPEAAAAGMARIELDILAIERQYRSQTVTALEAVDRQMALFLTPGRSGAQPDQSADQEAILIATGRQAFEMETLLSAYRLRLFTLFADEFRELSARGETPGTVQAGIFAPIEARPKVAFYRARSAYLALARERDGL